MAPGRAASFDDGNDFSGFVTAGRRRPAAARAPALSRRLTTRPSRASFIQGIFLSNPDGSFKTIVDNTSRFASVSDPSLNIFGRAAFQADRFDAEGRQLFSINTSRGGPVTTVAESNPDPAAEGPVYSSFREPSLNDLGRVAFTADVLADPAVFVTTQGVFTGTDPGADKVLQVGDRYQGVPVTSVFTCSEALNNRGQIAMIVRSENPDTFEVRTFVVKATPR